MHGLHCVTSGWYTAPYTTKFTDVSPIGALGNLLDLSIRKHKKRPNISYVCHGSKWDTIKGTFGKELSRLILCLLNDAADSIQRRRTEDTQPWQESEDFRCFVMISQLILGTLWLWQLWQRKIRIILFGHWLIDLHIFRTTFCQNKIGSLYLNFERKVLCNADMFNKLCVTSALKPLIII